MNEVILLLGSNLDDKKKVLLDAVELLQKQVGTLINSSCIYETAAWGNEDQPTFLNQVVILSTALSVSECLKTTQAIETKMGRVRFERWGPRIIDIDILFYNDLVKQEGDLIVPHAQLHKRKFTLVPLAEVASKKVHPIFKVTIKELLESCHDPLEVHLYQD